MRKILNRQPQNKLDPEVAIAMLTRLCISVAQAAITHGSQIVTVAQTRTVNQVFLELTGRKATDQELYAMLHEPH